MYCIYNTILELALLHNKPRAANVAVKGSVRVATLGKDAFTRLLEPAVDVMKRHSQPYGQINKEALTELLRNRLSNNQNDEAVDDFSTATEDN
jgi:CRP-like cAMP-binding protein